MSLCAFPAILLRSKLRLKVFEAVVQRIQIRYHLAGLTEDQVGEYIRHHMI
jgi:type II secretory pathway predicted ATPase ExeA